ncbi:CTAG/Pcc1 family [Phytophthora cactorum]|nr:CTAG/Pcc1 family [Phytophthora cactorum]
MTSATHPFEWYAWRSPREISLGFPEEVDALYVLQTLEVDEELQPEKIHRTLTVKGDELHVYDAFHFEATEIRLLRAAVSSFYDMSVLTARTLLEFKE